MRLIARFVVVPCACAGRLHWFAPDELARTRYTDYYCRGCKRPLVYRDDNGKWYAVGVEIRI